MKKLIFLLIGIVFAVLAGCTSQSAKIGVVDVVKVAKESNEGRKAYAELDALIKARQEELKQKADSIKDLKDKLEKTPAESKQPIEEELKKASDEYHKLAISSEAEVKNKSTELNTKMMENLKKVINDIGSDEKFTLILIAENTLYFQKTIDISDKVLKQYNESTKGK